MAKKIETFFYIAYIFAQYRVWRPGRRGVGIREKVNCNFDMYLYFQAYFAGKTPFGGKHTFKQEWDKLCELLVSDAVFILS